MSSETQSWMFSVPEPASLVLSNVRGSTLIRAGESSMISITAVKRPDSGDAHRTEILVSQDPDGQVKVETRSDLGGILKFMKNPCAVEYTVQVPQGTRLTLNGVSSSLKVEGLQGLFSVSSVSGTVHLAALTGPLQIHTVSGDVKAERLDGSLVLDTVSGNVWVAGSQLSEVNGSTVSGDVWLETSLHQTGRDSYRFSSVSGNVDFLLPAGTGCEVECHSLSGTIRANFPVQSSGSRYERRFARVNGGGPRVSFNSVSGNIGLNSEAEDQIVSDVARSDFAVEEPLQPDAEEQLSESLSHLDILQKIEMGELSVEQGLALLG